MRVYHVREIESEIEREAVRTSAWVLVIYACYGEWHLSRKVCYQTSSFFLMIIRRGKETDNYMPRKENRSRDKLSVKKKKQV